MLCLSRKEHESICIPTPLGPVWICIVEIRRGVGRAPSVRLGLDGPRQVEFIRAEIMGDTPETCESAWGVLPIGEEPRGAA